MKNLLFSVLVGGLLFGATDASAAEPISITDGDYSHITSFKLKSSSAEQMLNDHARKGWRLVAATSGYPTEFYFEKSKERFEYRLVSRTALTTTKELKVVNESSTDGWKLRTVLAEPPIYTFVMERPKH